MDTPTIRGFEPNDLRRASASLASAFADDPVVRWTIRDDARPGTLVAGMRTNVELFSPHGFSLVEADVDGVALWCRHDQWALPAWRELLLVPRMLRFTGLPRLARLRDGFDTMKAHHPRTPHYYLFMIGVRADRQGQGLGAALMRPMLERCEAEGVAAYLEASSPRNIAFYRRMGFEERETFAFGPGGPPLCAMWWEPGGRRHSGERAR